MDEFPEQLTISKQKYHVRVQQRNGKKCITLLEGIEDDLDAKRICKSMQKTFNCNGNVKKDFYDRDVIQLQGDQRENVKKWLIEQQVADITIIVIHGF